MINKWNIGVSCVFRTTILEAWLKAIKELDKEYKFTESNCKWSKSKDVTIFSFATSAGKTEWENASYIKKPDFVFYGIPEGVKYV